MPEHAGWGAQFAEYSRHNFDPPRVSDQEANRFYDTHKVPHITVLERKLREFSSNTVVSTSKAIKTTIWTLWNYIVATKRKEYSLLNHYYGFLCLRYLIHFTCRAVLAESDTTESGSESQQLSKGRNNVPQATAFTALDLAGRATRDPLSFPTFCKIFTQPSFLSDSLSQELFRSLLSKELWDDRDKFLTLCLRGQLPGFSLLLLAAMAMLELKLETPRLYLAGSHRDRQVLHPVCMASVEKGFNWPENFNRFLSPEDSRSVSQAYSGLLFVWKKDGWNTKSLSIDFIGNLSIFALHMSGFNTSATVQEQIQSLKTAFQFMWLIFEDRGRIPVSDHCKFRYFATPAFSYLWYIQGQVSTPEEQLEIAQTLAGADVVGLAGRLLLMVLDEGKEFQNTTRLKGFLDSVYGLQEVFDKSLSISGRLFHDSGLEWGKVWVHMGIWHELGHMEWTMRNKNAGGNADKQQEELLRHISSMTLGTEDFRFSPAAVP
ncbi:hypothetical protein FRC09_015690 [Ceratobasidium sp. 395]|nr:hypothetical protein FRC09_015690 [Ceratobasidium sp. 395]